MAATYITMAELRSLLGIQNITLYSDATVEEVAQCAEDICKKYLWFNTVPIAATELTANVATITTPTKHGFRIDQSVVISSAGSVFNGTKTITGTDFYTFTYAKTASDQLTRLVRPYGLITGEFNATDYAIVPAIREATATLATVIWQSRSAPGATTVTIDGYIQNPYALGNTLIAKVRGLLSPYQNPNSMVG
jgi:flavin-binding protein dodecin